MVIGVVTAFLLFLTIAFSLKVSEDYSRLWILSFATGTILLVIGGRVAVCTIGGRLSRRGIIGRNVVVLGTGEQARRFLARAGTARLHFARVGGVFSPVPAAWVRNGISANAATMSRGMTVSFTGGMRDRRAGRNVALG